MKLLMMVLVGLLGCDLLVLGVVLLSGLNGRVGSENEEWMLLKTGVVSGSLACVLFLGCLAVLCFVKRK